MLLFQITGYTLYGRVRVDLVTSYFRLRGYLDETGTNSDWYELVLVWNFCSCLHEAGMKRLLPHFGMKWYLLSIKIIYGLTEKHTGLKFLYLVWDLLSFAWDRYKHRPVREFLILVQQPRRSLTRVSSLSGRPHVKTQNKCMEADTNLCQSEFFPVSCKYPLSNIKWLCYSPLIPELPQWCVTM